jgi:hypothetical protein
LWRGGCPLTQTLQQTLTDTPCSCLTQVLPFRARMVEGIQEWEETVGLVRKLRQWRERDDVQERGE